MNMVHGVCVCVCVCVCACSVPKRKGGSLYAGRGSSKVAENDIDEETARILKALTADLVSVGCTHSSTHWLEA